MPTDEVVEGAGQEPEPEGDTFPRDYVEKLRRENAEYRTRAKQYDEVFGRYDEEDREVLMTLARDLYDNPRETAAYMRDLADGLLEQYGSVEAATEAVEAGAAMDKDPRYVTWEELESFREQQALDSEIASIEREARQMGYDPDSSEYIELLWTAQHKTGGDLGQAHQALQEKRQEWVDQYVTNRTAEADSFPAVTPGASGVAPSTERTLKTWDDAKAALEARITAAEANR